MALFHHAQMLEYVCKCINFARDEGVWISEHAHHKGVEPGIDDVSDPQVWGNASPVEKPHHCGNGPLRMTVYVEVEVLIEITFYLLCPIAHLAPLLIGACDLGLSPIRLRLLLHSRLRAACSGDEILWNKAVQPSAN